MRILLIRTSALGDVVHSLPTLRALRRTFPEAEIAWVVETNFAPLLVNDPDLDHVFQIKLRGWRKAPLARATWSEGRTALRAIRAFSADLVLDLMGNHKAGAIAYLSSCQRRVGLARRYRREPSSAMWINETAEPSGPHAVEMALAVARAIGAETAEPDFGPAQLAAAGGETDTRLPEGPYAVIHPGAAWPSKRYRPERWGRVSQLIREQLGWPVLISIGPGEDALGEEVLAASDGSARTAKEPSIPGLVSLLDNARAVLAGDTGPLHLAHGLGTPVVALMGPTDPRVHGPYGAQKQVLRSDEAAASAHGRRRIDARPFEDIHPCAIIDKIPRLGTPKSSADTGQAHGQPTRRNPDQ